MTAVDTGYWKLGASWPQGSRARDKCEGYTW